jgi:hypothetical protein
MSKLIANVTATLLLAAVLPSSAQALGFGAVAEAAVCPEEQRSVPGQPNGTFIGFWQPTDGAVIAVVKLDDCPPTNERYHYVEYLPDTVKRMQVHQRYYFSPQWCLNGHPEFPVFSPSKGRVYSAFFPETPCSDLDWMENEN